MSFSSLAWAGDDIIQRQTFLSAPPVGPSGLVKVAFFDADSTIRVSRSGLPWATHEHDFIVLPNVVKRIRALNDQGYLVAIVSNQGRIPVSVTFKEADDAFYNLTLELKRQGAIVHYFDFAEKVDEFRKPNPGMFYRLERNLQNHLGGGVRLDKAESFMVGDAAYTPRDQRPDGSRGRDFSSADRGFAQNAGILFVEANRFFQWDPLGFERMANRFQAVLGLRRCGEILVIR